MRGIIIGMGVQGRKRHPIAVDKIKPESEEEQKRYDGALRRRQLSLVLAGKMKAKDASELMALFS